MEKQPESNQNAKEPEQTNKNTDQKKEEPSDKLTEEDNFLFNLIKESLLEEGEKEKEKEKEKDKNILSNK
jgi:hypothetical protein